MTPQGDALEIDDDRLDELAELEGWAQADDAWQPGERRIDETTAPDYDGAGSYLNPWAELQELGKPAFDDGVDAFL